MNSGYKQFFKTAQEVKNGAKTPSPGFSLKTKAAPKPARLPKRPTDPEALLRKALGRPVRKKEPFPVRATAVLAVCLMALGFYVAAPEVCESWFARFEIAAFGQASAKEVPAKAAELSKAKSGAAEKAAGRGPATASSKNPDEKTTSAEDFSHFEKLKQRKEELDLREKELVQLEEELQRQKVELDKRITQLEEMREQIKQVLKDRVEVDQEKVAKLVDLYSNMKPKQAAEVLGSINEELAVEVLAKMKKKSAAEIMNLLPADKAKVLSEKYTGYRRAHGMEQKGS